MVVYFAYGSKKLTFDFDVQLLRSRFQKNPGATAIAPVIDIGPVICKLLRFPQVQGERKQTLVPNANSIKHITYCSYKCIVQKS